MIHLDISAAFVLGLLTPLTAVCVLPLYPAFLVYLSSKLYGDSSKGKLFSLGLLVVAGVILFMFLLGLIFTTILEVSLTSVIGIISPIAFVLLAIISILLIFNVDLGKFLPKYSPSVQRGPYLSAFLFGFFFGAIVVPCNPLFIAALFTKILYSGTEFVTNFLSFLSFGLGIGFPLLLFSAIPSEKSGLLINKIVNNKRKINLFAGIIMLGISLYYLFFVFRIFGG